MIKLYMIMYYNIRKLWPPAAATPQITKYYETFIKDIHPKIDCGTAPLPFNSSTR